MDIAELNERYQDLEFNIRSEDRLQAYISGDKVDCLPYSLFGAELIIGEDLGYTTKMISDDFEKFCEIIQIKRDDYGLEDLLVGMGLRTMGQAYGSKMHVPDHGIESVQSFVLEDGYEGLDEMEVIDPYNNPVIASILEMGQEIKKRFPDMAIVATVKSSISAAQAIRPVEKMLVDTRKDPERLHALLELCLESNLACAEAFHKSFGPVRFLISDPVASGNLLSKDQYLEFALPYFARLIKGIKERTGLRSGAHICGYSSHFWEELKDLDLAYFSLDNCESLVEAKEILGEDMMIVGNVPPVDVLRLGTIDDVTSYCKESIAQASTSPQGFMMMSGCDIPLGTPLENVKAFVWATKTYGAGTEIGKLPEGMGG